MATRFIEPDRRDLPPRTPRRATAKRRPRRPITILETSDYLRFRSHDSDLLLSRERIGDAVEVLIALLDLSRPDPDLEETNAEDSFELSPHARGFGQRGPGCPVSEPDCGVDDERHDPCPAGDDAGSAYGGPGDGFPGDPDDTEANGDEKDGNNAEDEVLGGGAQHGHGAGCPISDPAGGNVEDEPQGTYGVDC
jgi:hypothetical protein